MKNILLVIKLKTITLLKKIVHEYVFNRINIKHFEV